MSYSQHAIHRMQQRGIKAESVETLLAFGRFCYHEGREIVFIDKRAMRALQHNSQLTAGDCDRLARQFLVIDDGAIVTVGHKTGHFKRDRH